MSYEAARQAAVNTALEMIEPNSTIGLGSGRAVFALTAAAGDKFGNQLRAVTASSKTAGLAREHGIEVVDLNTVERVEVAFDGADEIDPQLQLVKGKGAAMLWEKLLIETADLVVIVAEANKLSDRLGTKTQLPVEVVSFGWKHTLAKLESLSSKCELRMDGDSPKLTDEGNYIIDIAIPTDVSLSGYSNAVKQLTGVVEHGLFLDNASIALVGNEDGSVAKLKR